MSYIMVGNTTIDWREDEPLVFEMTENHGTTKETPRLKAYRFDLTTISHGVEMSFLLNLKDHFIERRNKVQVSSIFSEYRNLKGLINKVLINKVFEKNISVIDEVFLLSLTAMKDKFTRNELKYLKLSFKSNPFSMLFTHDVQIEDFPTKSDKKGLYGSQVSRIIKKALTRSACVEILTICENAYENHEMDIGHFSFVNLAFSVFCRPESYRQIRIKDLVCDADNDLHFIYIKPVKSQVNQPERICYKLSNPVGLLLQKQRQNVVEIYGHLVEPKDIGELALFPARQLKNNKQWKSEYSNKNFGEIESSESFSHSYTTIISKKYLNASSLNINANRLRHTVGTQLAFHGCSAKTIMAVLKHSSDIISSAYVDIAFEGLIDNLSDAMMPAFEAHFPVFKLFRSKNDVGIPEKVIYSDDIETGRTELVGECGKQIRCEFAPLACYGCPKFIPCFDADHSINLQLIEREIDILSKLGKPYQSLIEKAQMSRREIILVIYACENHKST